MVSFRALFFLITLVASLSAVAGPLLIHQEQSAEVRAQEGIDPPLKPEDFYPNCRYLEQIEMSSLQLDRLWYISRPLEILQRKLPDGKRMLKIHSYWGVGACGERGFIPDNSWVLDPEGRIAKDSPFLLKAYTNQVMGEVLQDVVSVNIDKDKLLQLLSEKSPQKIKVRFTLHGLHDGFFYQHRPFINLVYQFDLIGEKIHVSLKPFN